jgi:hypothetical protein
MHVDAAAGSPTRCGNGMFRVSLGAGYGTGFYQYRADSLPMFGEPVRPLEFNVQPHGFAMGAGLAVTPLCLSGVAIGGEFGVLTEPSVEHEWSLGGTELTSLTLPYAEVVAACGSKPIAPLQFEAGVGAGYAAFGYAWGESATPTNVVRPRANLGLIGHVGVGYQLVPSTAFIARLYSGYFANSAERLTPLIGLAGLTFRF